jgi:hypothetical protein
MLHLHLFVSFIMRAFMALLKDILFVGGVGLRMDVIERNGSSYFSDQVSGNAVRRSPISKFSLWPVS